MFFQIPVSPAEPQEKYKHESSIEEIVLKLAPFTPNPKIFFENVAVGEEITKFLTIENPNAFNNKISITKLPPADRNVALNWNEAYIEPNGRITLEITWTPKEEGGWRDVLSIIDCRNVKRDIPIIYKSLPKKMKKRGTNTKSSKTKSAIVTKTIKVPGRKFSPTTKKIRSPFKIPVENTRISNIENKIDINSIKMSPYRKQKPSVMTDKYYMDSDKENSPVIYHSTCRTSIETSGYSTNYRNSETLNVSYSKLSFTEKLNRLENSPLFASPTNMNFICDNFSNTPLRRETYNIKPSPKKLPTNLEKFDDSLEFESQKDEFNFDSTPEITKKSLNIEFSKKLSSDSFTFSPLPKNTPKNFKFLLNDTEIISKIFQPSKCSTEEKHQKPKIDDKFCSHNKELFKGNNTYDLTEDDKNISTDTYNVSGGTYTMGNTSTTSTYSVVSPEINKFGHTTADIVDNQYNIRRTSSPVLLSNHFSNDNSNYNYLNFSGANAKAALSCITEEELSSDTFHKNISSQSISNSYKRKLEHQPETILNISPPKRAFIKPKSPLRKLNTTWSKKLEKTERIRKKSISHLRLNLSTSLNKSNVSITNTASTSITSEPCHIDPFLIAAMYSEPNSKTVANLDPFISSTLYYDEQWLNKQMIELKKWLNALLTPPSELDTKAESKKVDVAKLWQQCVKKDLVYAPTKEKISSKYHTNSKLEILRKKAKILFHSLEIRNVLSKLAITIENKLLAIREDKNLHLDVGLQSQIMTLLLCYNPLWLRIGLETIYNESISLDSNSDVIGLSTFIMLRFFRCPDLMPKTKNSAHNKYLPTYSAGIKKFTLKKFLMLVYFLDQAKMKKLITHDPCLFCRDAPIKESKEILLSFSRELLSSIGDITKFLRRLGYEVSHKQSYIDEFDYAVKHLGIDLRDGIRLTKVMEIILLRNDLTCQLRGPAISRLQKIHNVKVAMDSLQEANYTIAGEIIPKDIVDGHREKTLSLLWQIIYKFQAPKFTIAATEIQSWWKSLKIVIKRRILDKPRQRRNAAAIKIQQFYRAWKLMRMERNKYLSIQKSIQNIQKYSRSMLLWKKIKLQLTRKHDAATKIQQYYKAMKLKNIARTNFLKLKNATIILQTHFRAYLLMKQEKSNYLKLKQTTITIQRNFRLKQQIKNDRNIFLQKKQAAVTIQKYYKSFIQMKTERTIYLLQRQSIIKIQRYFKSYLIMKTQRHNYIELRNNVITIQRKFRALQLMKEQQTKYLKQKQSVVVIQKYFRAWILMKNQRKQYLELKLAVVTIQQRFLSKLAMKNIRNNYLQYRDNVIKIQQLFRANKLMKMQHESYKQQKKAVIIIQQKLRDYLLTKKIRETYLYERSLIIKLQQRVKANLTMKKLRKQYLQQRKAIITIQQRYKANLLMKQQREIYLKQRNAIITIQKRLRSTQIMKITRKNYITLRKSTIVIQQLYKAKLAMINQRNYYLKLKNATKYIQTKYRANKAMKQAMQDYNNQRNAVITIQQYFKSYLIRKEYIQRKKATICIQKYLRSYILMKQTRQNYLQLKNAANVIQNRFRATLAMKQCREEYLYKKQSVKTIQRYFIAYKNMKEQRNEYLLIRTSSIVIQNKWRSTLLMRNEVKNYTTIRKATICIQQRFRAYTEMKQQRNNYLKLKNKVIIIQQRFKAIIEMKKCRENYLKQRNAVKVLQKHFKAYLQMKNTRNTYLQLKTSTILIQRRFKAYLLMKETRKEYLQTLQAVTCIQTYVKCYILMKQIRQNYLQSKNAAIVIQNRLRATLAMKKCREEYLCKKRAVITIQKYFNAYKLMKKQRNEYLLIRTSSIVIQNKWRSTLLMRKEVKNYTTIRKATICIQQNFKAYTEMKKQRNNYLQLKKNVIIIQQRFKATIEMKKCRETYLTQRNAAIILQKHFRANVEMKNTHNYYKQLKYYVILMQQRFRANLLMIKLRNEYLIKRKAIIILQQRFKANIAMKNERENYLKIRETVKLLQERFRANVTMKKIRGDYLRQKQAAIVIQQQFRAYKTMKIDKENYQLQRNAAIVIQQKLKATIAMKKIKAEYIALKFAAVKIQQQFRAQIQMRNQKEKYLALKSTTIMIQQRYKSKLLMKQQRTTYLKQIQSIIIIQQHFKAYLAMKKQKLQFNQIKNAAIVIQNKFRSYLQMKYLRIRYLNVKLSIIKIQSYYRNYLIMNHERTRFLQIKHAAIVIQRSYRVYLKKQRIVKENALIKIQSWYRMKVAQKLLEKLREDAKDTEEKRIQRRLNKAAVKIQAAWRGYKTRSMEDKNITLIRERTKNANSRALPEHTMGQRNIEAIEMLMYQSSMKEIITALTILDFTTRLFPTACISMVDRIVEQLYILLANANRSIPDMEACGLCISVLINLYKFQPTSSAVWRVDYIDTLLYLLLNWSDKEGFLFTNLCTLIWLFVQKPEYCKAILKAENASKMLIKSYQYCERKQKMLSRMKNSSTATNTNKPMTKSSSKLNNKLNNLSYIKNNDKTETNKQNKNLLPSLIPDWGIVKKEHPRTFQNSLFGIKCILKKLNITVN